MRVLVCGGRAYTDCERVFGVLGDLHRSAGITCIINGGARGADALSSEWAKELGVPTIQRPADWKTFGLAAGRRRNAQMMWDRPDIIVAFPGGAGTADMIGRGITAGLPVYLVEQDRVVIRPGKKRSK